MGPSGRLLDRPPHHLRNAKILSKQWGPPHIPAVVALRPGGWILVEDADFVSFMCVSAPRPELFRQAGPKLIEAMDFAGYQSYFGRELVRYPAAFAASAAVT